MRKLSYIRRLFSRLGGIEFQRASPPGLPVYWVASNPANGRRLRLSVVGSDTAYAPRVSTRGGRWSRPEVEGLRWAIRWLCQTTILLPVGRAIHLGLDHSRQLDWTAKLTDAEGHELHVPEQLLLDLVRMARVAAETKEAGPLSDWVEESLRD